MSVFLVRQAHIATSRSSAKSAIPEGGRGISLVFRHPICRGNGGWHLERPIAGLTRSLATAVTLAKWLFGQAGTQFASFTWTFMVTTNAGPLAQPWMPSFVFGAPIPYFAQTSCYGRRSGVAIRSPNRFAMPRVGRESRRLAALTAHSAPPAYARRRPRRLGGRPNRASTRSSPYTGPRPHDR